MADLLERVIIFTLMFGSSLLEEWGKVFTQTYLGCIGGVVPLSAKEGKGHKNLPIGTKKRQVPTAYRVRV